MSGVFLDHVRLASHNRRARKREVVTAIVDDQHPLPWVLSGPFVGLVAPIIWIGASRSLTSKRTKAGFAPVENNDESRKSTPRKVASPGRGGGLVV